MLDAQGLAGGVLSTITLWPLALGNNYTDLNRALWYAWQHGGPRAALALGTEPFNGDQLPPRVAAVVGQAGDRLRSAELAGRS